MFTLFDLIQLMAPILGLLLGWAVGAGHSVVLGIVGAVGGGLLGMYLGWLPTKHMILSQRRRLSAFSNEQLEAQVNESCWIPNIILLELKARGVDVSRHLTFVLGLMRHDMDLLRIRGYAALMSAFPEQARELKHYNPTHDAEKCRAAVSAFLRRGGHVQG